jgi:hypothetical protein
LSRPGAFRESFAQELAKSLARGIVVTGSAIVMTLVHLAIRHWG